MFDYVKMGNRILLARIQKKIKQQEIGKALGISQSTYSGYETGSRKIEIDQLYELSDMLDVPVQWLLGIDNNIELSDSEQLKLEEFKKYLISQRHK
jgi:transcriptional regulator with XRE-family HTH domain